MIILTNVEMSTYVWEQAGCMRGRRFSSCDVVPCAGAKGEGVGIREGERSH